MNTIKKTTLIAVITAIAAIAVPAMASAAVWGPINTNKTLTSTSIAKYAVVGEPSLSFQCSSSTLGVHVRTPASSTLDITSASFTGCTVIGPPCALNGATVTATGLPWAVTASGSSLTFTEHLQVTEQCWPGTTFTVDGPANASYNNATHTLSATPSYPNMIMYYLTSPLGAIGNGFSTSWHETTNTLNLT